MEMDKGNNLSSFYAISIPKINYILSTFFFMEFSRRADEEN